MSKEEQWKREAEIKLDELDDRGFDFDNWSISDAYERGYCDCAEPREKRIEELENKIADIKANCDFTLEGKDVEIKGRAILKGDRKMKCDCCGKSAKTLFKKLLYRREYGCELMFYYCPKCYRKLKKTRR